MFVLYIHTNRCNGKRYVGCTEGDKDASDIMMDRWGGHCADSRRDSKLLFHKAIRKYGENAWDHDVLEVQDVEPAAIDAEIRLIEEYKTFAFDSGTHGYNMTRGGEGTRGHKFTDEQRKNLIITFNKPEVKARRSQAQKIAQNDPETKKKHAAAITMANARPETTVNRSNAQKITKNTPEARAKNIAAQNRPEVNAKRSESLKAYYARLREQRLTYVHDAT